MDKFGYIRGRRGPPGPAGKDAFDMAGWTPKALLKMFRENSDCSFYFKSETDCIWYDEKKQPIGLLNHGNSDFNRGGNEPSFFGRCQEIKFSPTFSIKLIYLMRFCTENSGNGPFL